MRPNTAPTGTLAPSWARISPRVPATGAGTSRVTLSVSSSATGSSSATASPGRFSHFETVASVIDSPSGGTLISVAISGGERVGDQMRLLFDVPFEKTGRWRRRLGAAGKACPLRGDLKASEDLLDPPVNEIPGAHILRLFLTPDDFSIAVAL